VSTDLLYARHPGICPDCDEPITPGDPIRHTPDGWTHAVCLPGPPARIESTDLCTACFTYRALSGACACD